MKRRIGHYIIKVCTVCGCELHKAQQKYCSRHANIQHIRKSAWAVGLTDKQLMHWHGVKL